MGPVCDDLYLAFLASVTDEQRQARKPSERHLADSHSDYGVLQNHFAFFLTLTVEPVQIVSRVSEAYGHMMLSTGLFHADAHPGNIMVLPKGVVGLIDYGQSKQLSDEERLLFAQLVVSLAECVVPAPEAPPRSILSRPAV